MQIYKAKSAHDLVRKLSKASQKKRSVTGVEKLSVYSDPEEASESAGVIGDENVLGYDVKIRSEANCSGFVTGVQYSSEKVDTENIELPGGRGFLVVDRDPDASPLVHLQVYDDIEDAKAHSMVKGAMEADCIVTIPAAGGKDLYLVFEKYISFCVCLIGGTGKYRRTSYLSLYSFV